MTRARHQPKRPPANELAFEIKLDARGSFFVECLAEHVAAQPTTSAQLRANMKKVLESLYFGHTGPSVISLHLVRDEMITPR